MPTGDGTPRTFAISTETAIGSVNLDLLTTEIVALSLASVLSRISTAGDALNVYFATALSAGDETSLDEAVLAHDPTGYRLKLEIKDIIYSVVEPPIVSTVSTSGLVITVDITDLIVNDQTTITADGTDVKHVLTSLIHNKTTDVFSILAREYTTGAYADLAADETLVEDLKEYTVVANGSVLVEV